MYAVFRVTEFLPPRRSVLAYGVNSTDAQVSYIAANCNASVIEECASIRVASASLALRNEVTRDIMRMIETATRRQAPGDLIKALTDLRDIDPPKADDLIEVRKLALALMMQYGIMLPKIEAMNANLQVYLLSDLGNVHLINEFTKPNIEKSILELIK